MGNVISALKSARSGMVVARVFRATVLVLALLFAFSIASMRSLDRGARAEALSPSEKKIALLHALPEGAVVPYGMQLVIHPWWMPFKNFHGQPAFLGYCVGPSDLRWRSDTELELRCHRFEDVRVRRRSMDGVRIVYKSGS
jgi:hypothetical protein